MIKGDKGAAEKGQKADLGGAAGGNDELAELLKSLSGLGLRDTPELESRNAADRAASAASKAVCFQSNNYARVLTFHRAKQAKQAKLLKPAKQMLRPRIKLQQRRQQLLPLLQPQKERIS